MQCCSHRRAEILRGHQLVSANSFGENCLVSYVSLRQACLNVHRYALPPTQGSHRQPSLQTPLFQSTKNQMFLWHLLGTAYQGQKKSLVTSKSPMAFTGCRIMLSMILHAVLLETATKTTMLKQQKRSCISAIKPTILTASKRSMLQTDPSTDKWDTYLPISSAPWHCKVKTRDEEWSSCFLLWRRRINPCQRNHLKKLKGSWASKSSARCNATIRADICKYNQIYSRWRNKNGPPSNLWNVGSYQRITSPQRMNLIHPQHLTNYRRPEIVFPPHRWKFFTNQYLFCCLAASNSHFRILRLINFFLSCNVSSSTCLFFLNSIGGLPVVPTRGLHWLHVLLTHHKSQRVAKRWSSGRCCCRGCVVIRRICLPLTWPRDLEAVAWWTSSPAPRSGNAKAASCPTHSPPSSPNRYAHNPLADKMAGKLSTPIWYVDAGCVATLLAYQLQSRSEKPHENHFVPNELQQRHMNTHRDHFVQQKSANDFPGLNSRKTSQILSRNGYL